jgi:hypothetical protein
MLFFFENGVKMKECFKKYWTFYVAFFFLVLGLFYYGKAYGDDHFAYDHKGNIYVFQHPLAIKHMDDYFKNLNCRALEYDDCHTNAQKVQFHKENGERCYEDAKERCWWLPYIPERDKARYCFTAFGAMAAPAEPRSKVIVTIITLLIQYGLDCTEEWHYINNKLYWSRYHFEMMEFHQDLVKHGYP